jgi:hypothetical protein
MPKLRGNENSIISSMKLPQSIADPDRPFETDEKIQMNIVRTNVLPR